MEQMVGYIRNIISVYKKNEDKLDFILKFIAGLFVFGRLGGFANESFGGTKVLFLTLICGVLTMIVSPMVFLMMMGMVTCLYIATVSLESALLVFCIFFIIFVFYVRIFPKESLIIPAMLAAYFFKIPYIIPLIVGIYIGIKGLGAVAICVFLQSSKPLLGQMMAIVPQEEFNIMGMLDNLIKIFEVIAENFSSQWIFVAGVYMLSVICAWAISNLSINNERLIAIGASGALLLFGTIICALVLEADISLIGALIGVPLSCLIVYVLSFLDYVLDYGKIERVKFQDDNFMYYVKAVPKIKR